MQQGDARNQQRAAPLVTGQIILPGEVAFFSGATVHVRLEDISYADAPAIVVAETIISDVSHQPLGAAGSAEDSPNTTVPFELRAKPDAVAIDPKNDYSVRVWVDRDSDGQPSADDLYSGQSYRVLTGGFSNAVTITLAPHNSGHSSRVMKR